MRAQKPGVIEQFSSLGSWRDVPVGGIYFSTRTISGLTELLRLKVASSSIKVWCVEQARFRTGFPNPDARTLAKSIKDYDETMWAKVKQMFNEGDNKHSGDAAKACRVMFEASTPKERREISESLPLGCDGFEGIGPKVVDARKLLDEWKDVVVSTEHDEQFYGGLDGMVRPSSTRVLHLSMENGNDFSASPIVSSLDLQSLQSDLSAEYRDEF